MRPPQQQRARLLRQRIIDTASELFVQYGYEGTSVRDIIAHASTTKGALYFQFKEGKASIAQAIMDDTLTMDGLQEQRLKFQEIIDIGMILAYRLTNEVALQAALRLSFAPAAHVDNPEYTTPWPDWVKFNAGQLLAAQEAGELKNFVDIEATAHEIAGSWAGNVMMPALLDRRSMHNVEDRIAHMYRDLVQAIGADGIAAQLDVSRHRGEILYSRFKAEAEPSAGA
ncbi:MULTISPECIES: TetR/AcrR family transcriptional regulator [unclassified Streptomyces]|uniref:TetR/AcrR family transcriptional regulator n=1 Tax=unclassified Streptomyces TaxID=2593676 RepID=UPI00074712DF|nr:MULTISPECIES: TetR/AcrR family transcriptional regulator [unclassified Streptomyces]KUL73915.1 hypothetical protein ADL34_18795 [Streptomyces sp. NRRL WC-3605]KUL74368.1 hypothetical protein ADL33_17895 [Streptomyces sp. NRRL WC-3604]